MHIMLLNTPKAASFSKTVTIYQATQNHNLDHSLKHEIQFIPSKA